MLGYAILYPAPLAMAGDGIFRDVEWMEPNSQAV